MNDVLKKLNNIIKNGETIVLANSGGPDSMCLFHILLQLRESKSINIICAHVNHAARKESDFEESRLKEICAENNVEFESINLKDKIEGNFHNESRKLRYGFFGSLLLKYNSDKILTAHHGDDLVETMILRLIRGASLESLSGFSFSREIEGSILIRPLINKEKTEILNYCIENDVEYFIDESNFKNDYFRNRIRNNLIPYLKEENENIVTNFSDLSNDLSSAYDYINKSAKEKYIKVVVNNKIDIKKFLKLHDALKRELLRHYLLNVYGENNIEFINKSHMKELEKIISSEKPNVIMAFPCDKKLVKEYNYIYVSDNDNYEKIIELELDEFVKNDDRIAFGKTEEIEENNNYFLLNKSEISLPLFVRSRKDGDFIEMTGGGRKKVKDILIDKKIPITERNKLLVLVDANDKILWLPGIYKSKYALKKSDNYDIILKYVKKH